MHPVKIVDADMRDATHYPLSLVIVPGDRFYLRFDYDSARIESEKVREMSDRLLRLLEMAVETPDAPAYRLDVMNDAERAALLKEFSATVSDLPKAAITERFEAQAASAPEGTALTCDGEELSYAELNERANRLAHYLIGLGVQPGALVGIALDRSVEMVVAILAVLKAGGAYLPLDPEDPRARLDHMLNDSGAEIVLTSAALSGRILRKILVFELSLGISLT